MDRIRHGALVPLARDLFGEVPVSLDDVMLWCLAVAGIAPDSPRFGRYVRDYNVLEKIRAAKIADTFDATISLRDTPASAPARLAQVATLGGTFSGRARPAWSRR